MSIKKVRWGIMSTASIGKRSVIPGIQGSDISEVKAVASRSLENAQSFAKEMNIEKAYGSYEELLNDSEIDAVYIPLPNHLHKEWTIKAAEAGKHILCEKPIALNEAEAKEMIAACEKAGVILAEAYMYRHQTRFADIKQRISNGEIGDIRGIHGVFTFNSSADKGNIRFTKEWGGGSIYDVGCYPISAARLLLDEEPTAVTAQAYFSPEHGNVDMMASGLMEFSNGVSLTFDCGMWAEYRNEIEILGTDGRIVVYSAFTGDPSYDIIKGGQVETIQVEDKNHYTLQADRFAESVLENKPAKFSFDDIVNNMKAVKGTLTSAEEGERVILNEGN